jgi:hypothetical protein
MGFASAGGAMGCKKKAKLKTNGPANPFVHFIPPSICNCLNSIARGDRSLIRTPLHYSRSGIFEPEFSFLSTPYAFK